MNVRGKRISILSPSAGAVLEELYLSRNRRAFVHPDPLEFLYAYPDPRDRELVGLIASSLAYGRVAQILKSVSCVLDRVGPSPFDFLCSESEKGMLSCFADFRHRFTTGEELARMLWGAKKAIEKYGSLHECFVARLEDHHDNIFPALSAFVDVLSDSNHRRNSLLPAPIRGSACKRFNLFLRWMVRRDAVDPGGWDKVPAHKLIIPLDTHMHKIGLLLNLTARRPANMHTAVEITRAFARLIPEDPTRYDFVLTRFGIREDMNPEDLFIRLYGG